MNYADRLEQAIQKRGNPCVIGLDPHLDLLPEEYASAKSPRVAPRERARLVADFLCEAIDQLAGRVPAVKPQSAFFEALGPAGADAWDRVVRCAKEAGLLVIADVKRGDIGSTSAAYARAFLDPDVAGAASCDAMTVNPYFADDGLEPFLQSAADHDAGLYVLVRTSNPSSARYQLHGEPPLCDLVAEDVERWGSTKSLRGERGLSSIGAVVGATHRDELARLRKLLPHSPLLLPGYGAQGAGAEDIVPGFLEGQRGALVNSSRGVLFASAKGPHAGEPWREAVTNAVSDMIEDIQTALQAVRS